MTGPPWEPGRAGPATTPAILLLAVMAPCLWAPATALEELPRKPGWSGSITLGAGGVALRSNTLAGSTLREVGEKRLDSLTDEAGRSREPVPVVTGDVGYFFPKTKTYVVLGNLLEDLVRYDFTTRLGVHQGLGGAGILAVDLLGSTTPALVWSDPFALGTRRESTERRSLGGRLTWDRIGGSGLEVEVAGRSTEVEDESSGEHLGLPGPDRRLLDRNGFERQVRVSYRFDLSPGHVLLPRVTYDDFDLDGRAMANRRASLSLAWSWRSPSALVVTAVYAGRARYDGEDPIHAETREDDILGLTVTAFLPRAIPGESWTLLANGGVYEGRSSIDFYTTRVGLAALAVLFRF